MPIISTAYGCGAHGDAVDWLMMSRGWIATPPCRCWNRARRIRRHVPRSIETPADSEAKRRRALQLWRQAQPIDGTLAERYLTERRGIDLAALPDAAACLRFHPRCPFGPATRHPCLIALRRDVVSDEPVSIHRIALTPDAQKIERRMLGRGGVVKLYPAGDRLIVGEGIETTLAAATRISRWGSLLQPAWSAVDAGRLGSLPLIPASSAWSSWSIMISTEPGKRRHCDAPSAGREPAASVVRLTPKRPGFDFNDLVLEMAS